MENTITKTPSHDLLVTAYNDKIGCKIFIKDLVLYDKYFDNIIVVDDCSDDGSIHELLSHAGSNLMIMQTATNSGRPSEPRNMALSKSSADIVTFLDIGDRIPEAYIREIRKSVKVPEPIIISGVKQTCPNPSLFQETNTQNASFIKLRLPSFMQKYKMIALQSGLTFQRKIAKGHLYETIFFEDWFFTNKLLGKCNNLVIIGCPILYKKDQKNLSPKKLVQVSRVLSLGFGARSMILYGIFSILKLLLEKYVKYSAQLWMPCDIKADTKEL